MNKSTNLQDIFLNGVRKEKISVDINLINGSKLTGTVKGFDNFAVILECGNKQCLLYKHSISSIIPAKNVNININE